MVDLDIRRRIFTMLGPSGSGKTTCLRLIAGLRPDTGRIELYARCQICRLARRQHGQDYSFSTLDRRQNVGYG
jgi:ABC-type Fe3+/spermidine/putrescine transport system ATPase subunit